MIIIVSLLLAVCVCYDYAETNITINATEHNVTVNDSSKVLGINESVIIASNDDKLYTDKSKTVRKISRDVPKVAITAKPSCGCNYGYYWHTNTFVNYCPHCGNYNCLVNKHKWQARYEQELTCKYCDSDYCGCCGKTKYNWDNTRLRRA